MRAIWLAATMLFAGACATTSAPTYRASAPMGDLTKRAVFDLNCPAESMRLFELGEDTFGVTGCGRQATYVASCSEQPGAFGALSCKWLMNTVARPGR
jgi:hypothetical protein